MKFLSVLCYIIAGVVLFVGSVTAEEVLDPKQKLFMRGCYLILQAAEDPTLGDGIAGDKYDFAMFMYATGIIDTAKDTIGLYAMLYLDKLEGEDLSRTRRMTLSLSNKELAKIILQAVEVAPELLKDPPTTIAPMVIYTHYRAMYEHQVESKK